MANYYSWDIKHNLKGFHCRLMGITCTLYYKKKQQILPTKGSIFNGYHNHKKNIVLITSFKQKKHKREYKNIKKNIET